MKTTIVAAAILLSVVACSKRDATDQTNTTSATVVEPTTTIAPLTGPASTDLAPLEVKPAVNSTPTLVRTGNDGGKVSVRPWTSARCPAVRQEIVDRNARRADAQEHVA